MPCDHNEPRHVQTSGTALRRDNDNENNSQEDRHPKSRRRADWKYRGHGDGCSYHRDTLKALEQQKWPRRVQAVQCFIKSKKSKAPTPKLLHASNDAPAAAGPRSLPSPTTPAPDEEKRAASVSPRRSTLWRHLIQNDSREGGNCVSHSEALNIHDRSPRLGQPPRDLRKARGLERLPDLPLRGTESAYANVAGFSQDPERFRKRAQAPVPFKVLYPGMPVPAKAVRGPAVLPSPVTPILSPQHPLVSVFSPDSSLCSQYPASGRNGDSLPSNSRHSRRRTAARSVEETSPYHLDLPEFSPMDVDFLSGPPRLYVLRSQRS